MNDFRYVGSELDLFREVRNWKSYWSRLTRPLIAGSVLEVGAGIGSNTPFLDAGGVGPWVCLEPDPRLITELSNLNRNPARQYQVICGTLRNIADREFDTIIYIDVLEHLQDDRAELAAAAAMLRARGRIIVLSPAHQHLFTPFDAAIGHFRRYNRRMLRRLSPAGLVLERLDYLDCVGLIASAANRFLLRQSMPTAAELRVWDRWMVPVSRVLDPLLAHSLGKSILAIWSKPDDR